jgi:ubiquinone/menaquinone biosynthesis C-methylase UbiE
MRYVELTGPTGVGKSAIYNAMLKYGGFVKNPKPTLNEALDFLTSTTAVSIPGFQDFGSYLDYVFRVTSGPRKEIRESGTLRALSKLAYCRLVKGDTPMIVDGGIIHRGWGIARLKPNMFHKRYYELLPLPDIMIDVVADTEVIKQRNRERGGDHDRSDQVEHSVEIAKLARRILESRGAKIIEVDMTHLDPDTAARKILSHILERPQKASRGGRNFNEHAKKYEDRRTTGDRNVMWTLEDKILRHVLAEFGESTTVLDAPCGTGRFFDFYREKGFQVIALDKEYAMVEQAQNAASTFFTIRKGDVLNTGLADKSADVAVNFRITRWLSPQDCQHMMREMQRVAKTMIVLTARIDNHPYARSVELFQSVLDGWELTQNHVVSDMDYRVLVFEPKRVV